MFSTFFFVFLGVASAADPALPLLAEWGDSYQKTSYSLDAVALHRQSQAVQRLPPTLGTMIPTSDLGEQQLRGIRSNSEMDAQFNLVRELTSGQLAELQLASYLRLPAPKWMGTRSWLDSLTPEEKREVEENNLYNLAESLFPTSTTTSFRLRPKQSFIVAETGTIGNGNGKVDAGEWVQVSLALSSESRQPAYSTSAWVSSRSSCVWVKERDELVVPEFRDEVSSIVFWLYVSDDCPQGKNIPMTVSVEDTWVNPNRPERLTFGLKVESAPVISGVIARIDGDTPGWSREALTNRLAPNSRYELRVDPELTGTSMAEMDYVLPAIGEGIQVQPDSYVAAPMVRSTGMFLASDDLDFTTRTLQQSTQWLKSMDRRWAENPDPRAVFAADVYSLVTNYRFEEPRVERNYFYRQAFFVPFTREAEKVLPPPPPPPPPRVVAAKPPPKPAPTPTPAKPSVWTVISVGLTSVKIEERLEDEVDLDDWTLSDETATTSSLAEVDEIATATRRFYPNFRLHIGKRVRGQIEGYFGTFSDTGKLFSFTIGPRVNVVDLDQFQLATFVGVGTRAMSESLVADVQTITKGGLSADVLLTEGFLVWAQTSLATKSSDDSAIAYTVLPHHLSFGVGGRF